MKFIIATFLLIFSFTASSQDVTTLYLTAKEYYLKGEFEKGIPYAQKSVELGKKEVGENSFEYGTLLNMLGLLYFKTGENEKAIPLFEKAKQIKKETAGEENADYLTITGTLAAVYAKTGLYANAEPLYIRLKEIKSKLLGENDPEYAVVVNDLASLYLYMGQYKKVEPLYLEALTIRKKALGENHPDYATSLDNLGALYATVNEYEKAEPLYKQAMEIRKNVLGETDDDYVSSLNNLASMYLSKGEYAKSEPLYLKAGATQYKKNGENNPAYATTLNNIGALYLAIGQFDKAELAFVLAMDIRGRVLGKNHPSYLTSCNNLSQIYATTGQYDKAIPLCIQTIAIRKNVLGENHPDYATSLNNLGVLYAETGEYAKGEPYCAEAAAIRKKVFGADHADYAASLNNLGLIYKGMGQYKKAEPLFIQAKEIYRQSEGELSPGYAISLDNLAILYITLGDYAKAEPFTVLSSSITLQNLLTTFPVLSEKEKGNYLSNKAAISEVSNNLIYHFPGASSSLRINHFNLHLSLKSLALSDTKNMINAVRNSKDSTVKKMLAEWLAAKNFLAKQYAMPAGKRDPDLETLEGRAEKIEKELSRKSANFRNQQAATSVLTADVQKNLQEDEAAIEFVSFHLYDNKWTDSVIYAACILRKHDEAPLFVPLFEESQLQQLFDSAGKTATITAKTFYRGLGATANKQSIRGERLYQLIWKPLEPFLKGIKKIAYSPAGKLYGIAFHAMPVDSTILLMDKYLLQQYTSTRQIALRSTTDQTTKPVSIALFGDANFAMDSLQLVQQQKNQPANSTGSSIKPDLRGTNSGAWPGLPGTAEEVKRIGKLFEQNQINASIFLQARASEDNLKAISTHSPQVLHIATHGFFLPERTGKKNEKGFNQGNSYSLSDDPLLRSGLILSGGNYAWSGKTPIEGLEDGIVTAYEISQLDLSNTELVVLSACETALGDVKGSEGVFGLQRAFKMAGVKKMIVSLWEVPDKETAELMTDFYTYWMNGKTINEAFTTAQSDMRKKYTPFYWAAFVLVE